MPTYPAPPGFHLHDGFFLRLGIGIGGLFDSGRRKVNGLEDPYTIKGAGLAYEISVGGAVAPGLILAGSLQGISAGRAKVHEDPYGDETLAAAVGSLAFLLDDYPNPQNGFHFGGEVGFSGVGFKDRLTQDDNGSGGFSIGAHVGYEWWVGADWGMGVMARLTYATGSRQAKVTQAPGADVLNELHDSVVSPAVLFTATYN